MTERESLQVCAPNEFWQLLLVAEEIYAVRNKASQVICESNETLDDAAEIRVLPQVILATPGFRSTEAFNLSIVKARAAV